MQIRGFQDIINLYGYMQQMCCDEIALETIVFTNIDFTSQTEDKYVIKELDYDLIKFYDRYRKVTFFMYKKSPKCFGQDYYTITTIDPMEDK